MTALPPSPLPPNGNPASRSATPAGPFGAMAYQFATGLRSGEIASIRDGDGQVLLSYRSFASVTGVIATLVSAIVLVAGAAAALFLFAEGAPLRAAAAFILTLVFAFFIAMVVPRVNVTLFHEGQPALTLSQLSVFPTGRWLVTTPEGATLGEIRKTVWSRLGRNRWTLAHNGRFIAEAREESIFRALVRKLVGKFSRRYESNFVIESGGLEAGRIYRRPMNGVTDRLVLTSEVLDRRLAIALATLVLGREP